MMESVPALKIDPVLIYIVYTQSSSDCNFCFQNNVSEKKNPKKAVVVEVMEELTETAAMEAVRRRRNERRRVLIAIFWARNCEAVLCTMQSEIEIYKWLNSEEIGAFLSFPTQGSF